MISDNQTVKYTVNEETDQVRLDKALSILVDFLSRNAVQKKIEKGEILVNGQPKKASYKLNFGDEILMEISAPEEPDIEPENIPLDILFEDSDVIVVNKPKDMVVHPAAGHYSNTLVNALMYHCSDLSGINGIMRPGIVHRIDKDTTGSIIACKNDHAHEVIAAQLKEHSINRLYRAICFGDIKEDGTVNKPIGRDKNDRKKMAVDPNGKSAVTHYKVLKRFGDFTYIECKLETGRTHQIRVHMASIGHPLLGDSVYSNRSSKFNLKGQTLHAMTLGFVHPTTHEYTEVIAPLPDYFQHLLDIL